MCVLCSGGLSREKEKKILHFAPIKQRATEAKSNGNYKVGLTLGDLPKSPSFKTPSPLYSFPLKASSNEWYYYVHYKNHADWMEFSGGFVKISS